MQLKRLWDTEGKKIVFTEGPTGHQCQVWTDNSGNLYIYDMAQWLAYNGTTPAGKEYDRSNWKQLTDQTVGFYDTNEATDLYHWDHGDDAYYEFVDWDGTVLKSGTVIEGGTPTAPADPTRPSTAEYKYTFAGWEPAVGPITKRTTYTATYTATPLYTISFESSIEGAGYFTDDIYGHHVVDSIVVDEGTKIRGTYTTLGVTFLAFGERSSIPFDIGVQQHANSGYNFVKWTCNGEDVPSKGSEPIGTVEGDMTYVAVYEPTHTATIVSSDSRYGTVSSGQVSDIASGTAITTSSNTLTIGSTTITATASTNCTFVNWTDSDGYPLPATISSDITIKANFAVASGYSDIQFVVNDGTMGSVDNSYFIIQDGTNIYHTTIAKSQMGFGGSALINTYKSVATANTGYEFVNWTLNGVEVPTDMVQAIGTVSGNATYVANFEADNKTATISSNDVNMGTVDVASITAQKGTTITTSNNTLTIGSTTSTATAESGYEFVDWTLANGDPLPATLTSDISIRANFQSDIPSAPTLLNNGEINSSTYNISFFNGTGNTGGIVFNVQSMEWTDNINAGGSAGLLTVLQDELDTCVGSDTSEYLTDTVGYFTATAWQYLEAVYNDNSSANITAAKNYIESVNGDVFTNTQPV